MSELGIQYPLILPTQKPRKYEINNPRYRRGQLPIAENIPGAVGSAAGHQEPEKIMVDRYDFIVQFCWTETPVSKRTEQRIAKEKEEAEANARRETTGSGRS